MEELEAQIKELIVRSLHLEGVAPEGIPSEAPLFGTGLGLDSIDALELAMALRKRYGVKIEANDSENRKIFSSVRSLAEFVRRNGGTAA
ncbi:MAG: phosphopantetheine-binding protein [Anaeromyxobacteraceae bacterium]